MFSGVQGRYTLFVIIILLLPAAVLPVYATHENDHRFTIYGTVRDGSTFPGVPLPNKEVVVQDAKTGQIMQRGVTDEAGKYSLVLHVHNSDVGKVVQIQVAGISKQQVLQFDPGDATTVRRARVDLIVFPSPAPASSHPLQ